MSRAPIPAVILRALLLILPVSSVSHSAIEQPTENTTDGSLESAAATLASTSPQERVFRRAIELLESGKGAYSAELPEQLLSLGVNLQRQGLHDEAVKLFKRGVHLSRINNGLYDSQQIPLLQREISSHLALGEYETADERQRYLYRVQMRSLDSGLPRAEAFMQQAQWQYSAYKLSLDGHGYARIIGMWDLYRMALNDIVEREGQTSLSLMPPLEGMLLAQYLIAGYRHEGSSSSSDNGDSINYQQQANRFNAARAQSYKRGQAVIQAMYDVQKTHYGENSLETAEALTSLGDWVFWHGEQEAALSAYQSAIAELVAHGGAEQEIARLFGEPVALPNYDGARPLPGSVAPTEDKLQLEFTVSPEGRVQDLERLDDNEFSNSKANRIMRKLRKTRFRPQLAMGEPVTTENVIRAYEIQEQ